MRWLLIIPAWFTGALIAYIIGRVLLPEMGLVAPGYWTWFWVSLWMMVSTALATLVKEILS